MKPILMSFFGMAFSSAAKRGVADHHNAISACDSLSFFGITFYQAGFKEPAVSAVTSIGSITNSYCEGTQSPAPFYIADLVIFAYQIELAIRRIADEQSAGDIQRISCCPKSLDESTRTRVLEALELRKAQLMDDLKERKRQNISPSSFKSTRLLGEIL